MIAAGQVNELDDLEHLQPFKLMMSGQQTKKLHDWVAAILQVKHKAGSADAKLDDILESMEA